MNLQRAPFFMRIFLFQETVENVFLWNIRVSADLFLPVGISKGRRAQLGGVDFLGAILHPVLKSITRTFGYAA